jgi:hypothetical protein
MHELIVRCCIRIAVGTALLFALVFAAASLFALSQAQPMWGVLLIATALTIVGSVSFSGAEADHPFMAGAPRAT